MGSGETMGGMAGCSPETPHLAAWPKAWLQRPTSSFTMAPLENFLLCPPDTQALCPEHRLLLPTLPWGIAGGETAICQECPPLPWQLTSGTNLRSDL